MVWCDRCKHSLTVPPTNVNVLKVSNITECVEEKIDTICVSANISEEELNNLITERVKMIIETYNYLKSRYKDVIYCVKRGTFVVRNPGKRTQEADMSVECPFFEPK